jgi:glycosyltransferase involved in cell wall biosynthesis
MSVVPNQDSSKRILLSVVVPAYDEQDVLTEFNQRLTLVLDALAVDYEIIYVNDGSSDSTVDVIESLHNNNQHIALLDLSRNFGKEAALTAGLDHAQGDAVIVIDADLQDPPEIIPQLFNKWQEGHDVVYAQRSTRKGETWVKRFTAFLFYRLMGQLGYIGIPPDTGDFRLMSRRSLEAVNELRESHRFMKGLFAWVGFDQVAVRYDRDPRYAGKSKWSYWRLWNFALEGLTSFTTAPLKLATYLGFVTAIIAFVYGVWVVMKAFLYGDPVAGYPSLMAVVLFLGAVQLMTLGTIGEYLARTSDEAKRRPLYFVKNYVASSGLLQRAEKDKP